ncbi:MAG: hypothetical protein QF510_00560 [Rhodospirillales bacterium]|nr:hypothetical protein [Rhodospirillales bacterium]
MAAIRTLLFDMDGVFCDYDFRHRLTLLEEWTGVSAAEIDRLIFKSGFEDAADWGHYGSDAYIEEVARLLGVPMEAETWLLARAQAMTPYRETATIARRLKDRYPMALLSNNGWLLRENISRILTDLPEIFGSMLFFSAETGASKENATSFAPLITILGWQATTTLFIDDNPVYTAAAAEAGLQTYQFTDPNAFAADLTHLGLD